MFFFYFGHVFKRFFIFQTFFILKNVGKVQSGKQVNKKHFQNNSNEIDLWFFCCMSNDLKCLPINFYLLCLTHVWMAYSELPGRPFLGHQAWSWTTLRRGNVFYYVYKRFFLNFCHVFLFLFERFYIYESDRLELPTLELTLTCFQGDGDARSRLVTSFSVYSLCARRWMNVRLRRRSRQRVWLTTVWLYPGSVNQCLACRD